MKLAVLRERRRDGDLAEGWVPGPERVAMFATGTPVANSLGEMWVMQSYLRPDLLESAGGGGDRRVGCGVHRYRHQRGDQRPGQQGAPGDAGGEFVNVPELVTMSSVYTDAVTRDQVARVGRIPELETGARRVISSEPPRRCGTSSPTWRGGGRTSTRSAPISTTR